MNIRFLLSLSIILFIGCSIYFFQNYSQSYKEIPQKDMTSQAPIEQITPVFDDENHRIKSTENIATKDDVNNAQKLEYKNLDKDFIVDHEDLDLTEQEIWAIDRINFDAIPEDLKEELKGYKKEIKDIERSYQTQLTDLIEKISSLSPSSIEKRKVLEKQLEQIHDKKEKELLYLMGADLYNQYITQEIEKFEL